jgi:acyl-CoA dehydrogenase
VFTTTAVRDGDSYLINGWKFFSSNARWATFLVVMAITDPSVDLYHRTSMFLVPSDTPGVNIVRNVGLGHDAMNDGSHALIHYDNVRVPAESLLGNEGQAFVIAQTRLGGGRVHHAMRTVGQAQRAFDMLCERALSRTTKGELLAEKQSVQNYIADSYSQITQFRLFLLYVAWRIDKLNDYRKVRHDIAAIKALMPQVLHDVVQRSMQVHGALGVSNELPLSKFWEASAWLALADGPSEVHRITVARQVLRNYSPAPGMWPTEWIPARQEAAREKFAELLEHEVGNF